MNKEEIIELIKTQVANELEIDVDTIDEDENFMRLGVDSVHAMTIMNIIKRELNVEISPVAIFEYRTISDFAEYLVNGGEDDDED